MRHQGDEDIPHAALSVLGANANDRFRIFDIGLFLAEVHILLDVLDRAVGAGGDGLHRGAAEPVNHRATADETEQHRSIGEAEV